MRRNDISLAPDAERPPGRITRVFVELLVWLLFVLFLPLVIRERVRRWRERRTPEGAARERTVQALLRKVQESGMQSQKRD